MKLTRIVCVAVIGGVLTPPVPSQGSTAGPRHPVAPLPAGGRPPAGPLTPTVRGQPVRDRANPRQGEVVEDTSQWHLWWELNQDPFLQLKTRIRSGAITSGSDDYFMGRALRSEASDRLVPSELDRRDVVIPALKRVLEDSGSNRNIVAACMVALARVGRDATILTLVRRHLGDADQAVRESAVLAMGIVALPEAAPDLMGIALDTSRGRDLARRPSGVDVRSRALACFGLGLIAYATPDDPLKRRVLTAMTTILGRSPPLSLDLQVAAVHGIRLLNPDIREEAGRKLRDEASGYLLALLDVDRVPEVVRAHACQGIARLLGRGDAGGPARRRLLDMLGSRAAGQWMQQSVVLALGEMATPADTQVSRMLDRYMDEGQYQQARFFAAIALGQIGGEDNRSALRARLVKRSTPTLVKPWIALGLALLDHQARQVDSAREIDSTAADILRQFEETRTPILAAGLAIALGIMRDKDAGDVLFERMLKQRNNDEAAGYLAVGLGLIGFHEAREEINELVEEASRRPELLTRAVVALGLLGDKQVGLRLVSRMREQNTVAVFSALARALGSIGDRRVIPGLVDLLEDEKLQPLNRAFAAAALGCVGDKELLPWNSKILVGLNYGASVASLARIRHCVPELQ